MAKPVRYHADVERDESGALIATVRELPGCHTYGRSLAEVRRRIPEAVSLWIDEEDAPPVSLAVVMEERSHSALHRALDARSWAEALSRYALDQTAFAIRILTEAGFSRRDCALLLGLSHQRVQQLSERAAAEDDLITGASLKKLVSELEERAAMRAARGTDAGGEEVEKHRIGGCERSSTLRPSTAER